MTRYLTTARFKKLMKTKQLVVTRGAYWEHEKKSLFKGFFDCFRLFPLDCTDRFIGEIPEHSVDAWCFLDDPVSDPV